MELMDTIDEYIPTPVRETDKPFLMPVEDVFTITGRGTVASGRIDRCYFFAHFYSPVGYRANNGDDYSRLAWRLNSSLSGAPLSAAIFITNASAITSKACSYNDAIGCAERKTESF